MTDTADLSTLTSPHATNHFHPAPLQMPMTPIHLSHPSATTKPVTSSAFKAAPPGRSLSTSSLSSLDPSSPSKPSTPSPSTPTNPSFSSPAPSSYTSLHPTHSPNSTQHLRALVHLFEQQPRCGPRSVEAQYPGFFQALSTQQKPKLHVDRLQSDSRVPCQSEITGLMPGEVFVHRNVANCVVHADLNLLACLQLAVDVLRVEHVIVCGHYGCGGVNFALSPTQIGLCDNWIRHIKDVARAHQHTLGQYRTFEEKSNALVELNVVSQVENVCHSTIVQNAWRRGQSLAVHGWVYGVHNGLLKNLVEPSIKGFDQISPAFHVDGPVGIHEP